MKGEGEGEGGGRGMEKEERAEKAEKEGEIVTKEVKKKRVGKREGNAKDPSNL